MKFNRLQIPYMCDATSDFMMENIQEWKVANHLQAITTVNAADMCFGVELLHTSLNTTSSGTYSNFRHVSHPMRCPHCERWGQRVHVDGVFSYYQDLFFA